MRMHVGKLKLDRFGESLMLYPIQFSFYRFHSLAQDSHGKTSWVRARLACYRPNIACKFDTYLLFRTFSSRRIEIYPALFAWVRARRVGHFQYFHCMDFIIIDSHSYLNFPSIWASMRIFLSVGVIWTVMNDRNNGCRYKFALHGHRYGFELFHFSRMNYACFAWNYFAHKYFIRKYTEMRSSSTRYAIGGSFPNSTISFARTNMQSTHFCEQKMIEAHRGIITIRWQQKPVAIARAKNRQTNKQTYYCKSMQFFLGRCTKFLASPRIFSLALAKKKMKWERNKILSYTNSVL